MANVNLNQKSVTLSTDENSRIFKSLGPMAFMSTSPCSRLVYVALGFMSTYFNINGGYKVVRYVCICHLATFIN